MRVDAQIGYYIEYDLRNPRWEYKIMYTLNNSSVVCISLEVGILFIVKLQPEEAYYVSFTLQCNTSLVLHDMVSELAVIPRLWPLKLP